MKTVDKEETAEESYARMFQFYALVARFSVDNPEGASKMFEDGLSSVGEMTEAHQTMAALMLTHLANMTVGRASAQASDK